MLKIRDYGTFKEMIKDHKKAIVLMSGGIDSSVAAVLLQKQGFDLTGIFIIFGNQNDRISKENKCCSIEAQDSARRVAGKLNIPFYTINLAKEFKARVIDYFISEYKKGRTPNPCVMCNKFMKFGLMLDKALSLGFDYVSTGHYLISAKCKVQSAKLFKLFQAKDRVKDQSYFLYTLTQKKLKHLLFPVGDYVKDEIRDLAKKFDLPVLERKESQGVCFVGDESVVDFLKKKIKVEPGEIVDINTKKAVGEHSGLSFYTIGQRQGIGVGGIGPYYVVSLDFKRNKLWVTNKAGDPLLFGKGFIVRDLSWVAGKKPKLPFPCRVRIRYGHPSQKAELKASNKARIRVEFCKAQRAITPGQAAVFYNKKELLGGGIIV